MFLRALVEGSCTEEVGKRGGSKQAKPMPGKMRYEMRNRENWRCSVLDVLLQRDDIVRCFNCFVLVRSSTVLFVTVGKLRMIAMRECL